MCTALQPGIESGIPLFVVPGLRDQQRLQMFKSLSRLTKTRSNVHLTFLGASVGLLGATLTSTSSDGPSPKRESYKYLICGGGIAAQSALQTLIENNASDLLLVTPEWRSVSPSIPPQTFLSSLVALFTATPEILVGPSVKAIDTTTRIATLDDGTRINFQKCLLAVGACMPEIPVGKVVSRDARMMVSGIQTNEELQRIESLITNSYVQCVNGDSRAHITIVGGGWLSPIIGAELIHKGADITFSYAEPSFLSRYFPRYLAQDVYTRLLYLADGGVDALSYAALRYVVARKSRDCIEAEVHVGTVFDAFSIIDFRTDHVVFAPTLPTVVPVDIQNVVNDDGLVANQELAVASDVYVAGAAMAVGTGAVGYAKGMRWSANHARVTGRHAALNMLGKRETYNYIPCLTVDLGRINLRVTIFGDVDGSKESFGYFQRRKGRGDDTCGGVFERGVLFCVEAAPSSFRGAQQRLLVTGIAIWDGSREKGIRGIEDVVQVARELVQKGAMTRPELEAVMDGFARDQLDIRLFQDEDDGRKKMPERPDMVEATDVDDVANDDETETGLNNGDDVWLRPLAETRRPSPGVIWRRHRAARAVRIREEELLWVENEWIGAASPNTKPDRMSRAYSDLLKRSAGKES